MKQRLAVGALILLGACGLQHVELGATPGDAILLDDVPPEAVAILEAADTAMSEPKLALRYPADHTAIPANIAPLTFSFAIDKKPMPMMPMAAGPYRALQLSLRGKGQEIRVYTRQNRATLPPARWRALLEAAEGDELTVTLRALDDKQRVLEGAPMHVVVLSALPAGVASYWSDTRASAQFARVDGTADDAADPVPYPGVSPWSSALTQSGYRALASDGVLSLTLNGAPQPLAWASALRVDYVDVSPREPALVFSAEPLAAMMMPAGMMMPEPGAMMMPPMMSTSRALLLGTRLREDQTFGEPETLVMLDKDESVRAPAYAPDGSAIVFERLKGRDKQGNLWLVPALGGEPAALLGAGGWKGSGAFPTWLAASASDEVWLAYSEARAPDDTKLAPDQLQLWALAFRLRTGDTPEPLGEPFWLPFQRAEDSNRRLLLVVEAP